MAPPWGNRCDYYATQNRRAARHVATSTTGYRYDKAGRRVRVRVSTGARGGPVRSRAGPSADRLREERICSEATWISDKPRDYVLYRRAPHVEVRRESGETLRSPRGETETRESGEDAADARPRARCSARQPGAVRSACRLCRLSAGGGGAERFGTAHSTGKKHGRVWGNY